MAVDLYDGDDGRKLLIGGMCCCLLASATWLLIASRFGLPVSTTHSIVGAVVAFGIVSKGWDSVSWDKIGLIIASCSSRPPSPVSSRSSSTIR